MSYFNFPARFYLPVWSMREKKKLQTLVVIPFQSNDVGRRYWTWANHSLKPLPASEGMHGTKIATFNQSGKLILNFSTNRLNLEKNKGILTLSTSAGDAKLTESRFGLEIRGKIFPCEGELDVEYHGKKLFVIIYSECWQSGAWEWVKVINKWDLKITEIQSSELKFTREEIPHKITPEIMILLVFVVLVLPCLTVMLFCFNKQIFLFFTFPKVR